MEQRHNQPCAGHITFELPAGRGHKTRSVQQEVRTQRQELDNRQGSKVAVTCLIASEADAPKGDAGRVTSGVDSGKPESARQNVNAAPGAAHDCPPSLEASWDARAMASLG